MKAPLPKLVITNEAQPKLYRFARHHPEILQVFQNVEKDMPLDYGVLLASGDAKDIVKVYIDFLHIPLLLEHKAIGPNPKRRCGYEPLVFGLQYMGYEPVYSAQVAADRAVAISKVAKPTDTRDNSLYCYLHGCGESVKASKKLMSGIRALIVEHALNPGEAEPGEEGTSFNIVVSARISNYESK